jgi:phage terminase large subunit-like protein
MFNKRRQNMLQSADLSLAERDAVLPEPDRLARIKDYFGAPTSQKSAWGAEALEFDWSYWGRPSQFAPPGDWTIWLMLAGRGFGKTRAGAEWVRAQAEATPDLRIALVADSFAEARNIMVEGVSGLMNIGHPDHRPTYEPSLKRLKWPNGAIATLYSAAEPDSLRGPEHHIAWCDELAKWPKAQEAWDMLAMTMRLGERPRIFASTTPRALPLIQQLDKDDDVIKTRGRSLTNRAHLSPGWLEGMQRVHGGTRLYRQEMDGELIEDVVGALLTRNDVEKARVAAAPALKRVVVGVDPPASSHGDACGIVVVGQGVDDKIYILADCTIDHSRPEQWARAVAQAAQVWHADHIVAEGNNGGDMVISVLNGAGITAAVTKVHARHGKVRRAEPVISQITSGRAFFAGHFSALEHQLVGLMSGGGYEGPGRSPDRADACVWACTDVIEKAQRTGPRVWVG